MFTISTLYVNISFIQRNAKLYTKYVPTYYPSDQNVTSRCLFSIILSMYFAIEPKTVVKKFLKVLSLWCNNRSSNSLFRFFNIYFSIAVQL